MSAVMIDEQVSRVGLLARCLEEGVHREDSWTVRVDHQGFGSIISIPVQVRTWASGPTITASFVAGPFPVGTHDITLELDGTPMQSGSVTFTPDCNHWEYRLVVRVD